LFEPPRAAGEAFAVVVLTDHLSPLAVEDHHGRGAAPALPARLAERVRQGADHDEVRDAAPV
jgi:hypothetical protein